MLVNVAIPIPLKKLFTYSVPSDFSGTDLIGKRVIVPFNRRNTLGFVVSAAERPEGVKISSVARVLDIDPVFSRNMLDFCKWISEYYICGIGEVLKLALPSLLITSEHAEIVIRERPDGNMLNEKQKQIIDFIEQFSPVEIKNIYKTFGPHIKKEIEQLKKINILGVKYKSQERKRQILLKAYRLILQKNTQLPDGNDLKYEKIMDYFNKVPVLYHKDIKKNSLSLSEIKKAVKNGFIKEIKVPKKHFDSVLSEKIIPAPPLELNREQKICREAVLSTVTANEHKTFLIHGITGSGKTVVYISVVSSVLKQGKSAIIMVPEISLTAQTVRNFRSYLGDTIAVLHSKMSDIERYESWENIKSGKYKVVIGPRSAVFAPLKDIGVIVVDEEHDSSYKQSSPAPRYCARNSAIMKGYLNNFPVVLGSATPSAESYYKASAGKYTLLNIMQRYNEACLPGTTIVKKESSGSIFENITIRIIARELNKQRKAVVLQNRRGYYSSLICRSCGETAKCPNCSVSLTFHLSKKQMICHHCGYFEKGNDKCKVCGDENIYFSGTGTEQVEEELKKLFPDVPVLRMDHDSTRKKDGHKKILDDFAKKGPAILTGTQMIAKGLDFHDVSVVCIVNVDSELFFPDFRSDERAFQLIEQVSGRAGRGQIKGKVIVQTFNPENPVIEFAASHDYSGFIKQELEMRKMTNYPPYSRLLKITISSSDLKELIRNARSFFNILNEHNSDCIIYEPVEKMVHKVNNIFRLYILIKSRIITDRSGKKAGNLVVKALNSYKSSSPVKLEIDVD
ncbi:MAG: primosomal protein N', partial [Candidatus Delongbacteria bacterium]